MRGGMFARSVQPLRRRLVQRFDHKGGFAAAGNPGDAGKGAERDGGGNILQIVAPRADHLDPAIVRRLAPGGGHRDLFHAGEILPGQALGRAHDVVHRALRHQLAAMDAGARPHVDDMIGGADRILIMLHHDHGVAEIAQTLQRFEQACVVALMQADGRFVQHIEHACKAGADLRGEPDALAFPAGQRAGGARQGEIFEPDIVEEFQPGANFLQDAGGDFLLLRIQMLVEIAKPGVGIADGFRAHFADVKAGDFYRQRLRLQAVAAAGRARRSVLKTFHLLPHPGGIGFLEAAFHIRDHAFETLFGLVTAQAVIIDEADLLIAGAVENDLLRPFRQIVPAIVEREFEVFGQCLQRLQVIGRGGFRPRRNRAFAQGQRAVRHDQRRIEIKLGAEPVTGGAGAMRVVEGEQPRLNLRNGEAGNRAGKFG